MKLVQLIHASRASTPVNPDMVRDILSAAERHNPSRDIAGFLAFDQSSFANWSTGDSDIESVSPSHVLRFMPTRAFDPFHLSGGSALALLKHLDAVRSAKGESHGL